MKCAADTAADQTKQRIAETYRLGEIPFDLVLPDWDFNVAPATFQPVIRDSRNDGDRELALTRWGLVPFSYPSFCIN